VLDAEERRVLVEHLLARTVAAARETPGVQAVAVVSPDPEVLRQAVELGADGIQQGGEGLNEGLREALAWAEAAAPDAILVIPGDLPAVSGGELARVVAAARSAGAMEAPLEAVAEAAPGGARVAARAVVALVPDRARTGQRPSRRSAGDDPLPVRGWLAGGARGGRPRVRGDLPRARRAAHARP